MATETQGVAPEIQVRCSFCAKPSSDVAKVIATTPMDEAFRPPNEGGCPLVKA